MRTGFRRDALHILGRIQPKCCACGRPPSTDVTPRNGKSFPRLQASTQFRGSEWFGIVQLDPRALLGPGPGTGAAFRRHFPDGPHDHAGHRGHQQELASLLSGPAHRMAKPRTPVDMAKPTQGWQWASSNPITEYIGTLATISSPVGTFDHASEVEAAVMKEGMAALEPVKGFLAGADALGRAHIVHPHDLSEVKAGARACVTGAGLGETAASWTWARARCRKVNRSRSSPADMPRPECQSSVRAIGFRGGRSWTLRIF